LARSSVAGHDLAAAKNAADAHFDALIDRAFNYDADYADLPGLGSIAILKALINADDLHMFTELNNTGKGNLFIIFREPDFDEIWKDQIQVNSKRAEIFIRPRTK
jgi:adenine-specific DNA-methyltransferase